MASKATLYYPAELPVFNETKGTKQDEDRSFS